MMTGPVLVWFAMLNTTNLVVNARRTLSSSDRHGTAGRKSLERGNVQTGSRSHYRLVVRFRTSFGKNWFLVGECLGFADPILAAGMTLTHTSAQHCAISILELERAILDRDWICQQYQEIQLRRIRQHIRFAEYWYSANGLFSSVVENCAAIAENSGLKLTPQEAFRWLSHGGIDDVLANLFSVV